MNIEHGAKFGNGAEIIIGDFSGIGADCQVPNSIKIGRYVMMGPDVLILGRNHEFADIQKPMMFQGDRISPPVVIEDDVWIGARAIIMPGVHIGKGSIVGAGAVVTKNIDPYQICAGNPARVIRSRGMAQ